MVWSYNITRAENGFIIENISDENYEDTGIKLIEDGEEEDGELESLRNMLYELKELFGYHYNKHNNKNIKVTIERK